MTATTEQEVNAYKLVEFFYVYPVFKSDLEKIPRDHAAIVGLLSFAVSEINAFLRMYIFSQHGFDHEAGINEVIAIQNMALMRVISAKLFEVENLLKFSKVQPPPDKMVIDLAKKCLKSFDALRRKDGYKVALRLRNEATHHYSFAAARKSCSQISANANLNLYIHGKSGNEFYPMGEELIFAGGLNKLSGEADKSDENIYRVWFEWVKGAVLWLKSAHGRFINELILKKHPGRGARKKIFFLDETLVGEVNSTKLPVIMRFSP